ncbi:MAG: putative collagen-binding domain-containing protein, partial [Anaerolineae bacterium]
GPEYPLGPITPLLIRRQAWWAFMAGGYYTNGQDRMWRMGEGWTATFGTPGAVQMGILRKIVERVPWWQRVPNQTLFDVGISSERTLNAAVRAVDSSWALLYLASQCSVRVNLSKIQNRRVKCTWINPATGEEQEGGAYETGNLAGTQFPKPLKAWFSVPGHWEDAILLMQGL